jgi:chromate transporter
MIRAGWFFEKSGLDCFRPAAAGPNRCGMKAELKLGHAALFRGFFQAGIIGFGGVLPFARRIIVDERRWMTQAEFNDLFSLCQFMPGANIVNFAFAFGGRHQGVTGAAAAVGGLLAAPVAIVLVLGVLYGRFGQMPMVQHGLAGLAAAASGLVAATAVKIAMPILRGVAPIGVTCLAFGLVIFLHVSLPVTMVVVLPLSVALAWRA